jgi:hypothetical protein
MALQPLWTLAAFSVSLSITVGRTPWTGDQPVARPLPTHRTTQTHNIRTQTSTPLVGFEPTIPVFERAKGFMSQTARLPEALCPGIKRLGREADHSPSSDAEVKKVGAIPPFFHTSSWRDA